MDAAEWIPMRWPAEWPPSALELLKGTPVNCLVVGGGAGLAAVLEKARALGVATTTLDDQAPPGVAAVPCAERSKLVWSGPGAVMAVRDGVWPGIQGSVVGSGGPTGVPWVDSNGWLVRLAKVRAPSKTLWIAVEPPAKSPFLRAASYELAVADAEAYGARWVVSLDERLRQGLAAGNREALDTWQKIAGALAFFKARRAWNGYELVSVAAVVSDFSGPNEELAGEILNLAARRPLPLRIIEKAPAPEASFEGLKAVICPDEAPPPEALRKKLLGFVRGGGLLIANAKWGPAEGEPSEGDTYRRFEVRKLGRGRLAVAREEMQDAYAVVVDAHLLLSRRHDPLRVFNAGSMNSHYAVSPDRRRGLLQLLNYAMRPFGHPVSVSFPVKYRLARLWSFEGQGPVPLEMAPQELGVEVRLPPMGAYAAVELEV